MLKVDNRRWQDASVEERQAVVKMYNKYYNNNNDAIDLKRADQSFRDSRWITIKYTFGVEPID